MRELNLNTQDLKTTLKNYYSITKPGMIRGNIILAAAGFLLASHRDINLWLLISMLVGLSLVIASGCVFNNYIDRDIDKIMSRTKDRVIARGLLKKRNIIIYGSILGILGFLVLVFFTNLLALQLALIGFVFYVVFYTFSKRTTVQSTLIGSISGAMSPVIGYCAVTNRLDTGAFLLFLILVLWQIPHFYSIAMYRFDDYKAAKIPVLPVEKGMEITKICIVMYIFAFIISTALLTVFGYTGFVYKIIMLIVGCVWLFLGFRGFKSKTFESDKRWARTMFFFSLVVIMTWSVTIVVTSLMSV